MRFAALLLLAAPLAAHVGSPDVFFEGKAGPYPVAIAIRPPGVIPGVAEVEIRVPVNGVRQVRVVPFPLVGPGAKYPPTPDVALRSASDPMFYTCSVWLMAFGSYQVRIEVDGVQGNATLSVPVPALATQTKTMDPKLGAVLFVIMLVLFAGFAGIVGASVREAKLEPGTLPDSKRNSKSRWAAGVTALLLAVIAYASNNWWILEANDYADHVYKPLGMTATLDGAKLTLDLQSPTTDDFIPDHGHLMHLFAIHMPEMDRMWHLHPEQIENENFGLELPSMPAGRYKLFADVVHRSGLPETAVTEITLPDISGAALSGDDADGSGPPLGSAGPSSQMREGYRMVWLRDATPLQARQLTHFTFRVEDAGGLPATGMQLYMGMQGHAEFVAADASVFAHVHPDGSVPMATLMLTKTPMAHPSNSNVPPVISFPYGFPKPGRYRIFVQVKRGERPETGVFDALVK